MKLLSIQADLSKEEDIRKLVEEFYTAFGHIDAFINNAGIAPYRAIEDKPTETFENTMRVNLYAPFLLTKLIAHKTMEQKSGKIVNLNNRRHEIL